MNLENLMRISENYGKIKFLFENLMGTEDALCEFATICCDNAPKNLVNEYLELLENYCYDIDACYEICTDLYWKIRNEFSENLGL